MTLIGSAYILSLPIAWNREKNDRSAGLRTFPIVTVATCGFMLVSIEVLLNTAAEARAMSGIITGMGFIGGGAILKNEGLVRGTATAASLWIAGAIGIAVAWQRIEIAIVLSLITFATLQFIPPVKPVIAEDDSSVAD